MPRIFACLAIANVLLLTASGTAGVFASRWAVDRHVLLAVLTLLFSCFVQIVVFTYLTVTGKMVGQAVHLAGLDVSILMSVKKYKRGVTRCLAMVFATVILVTATGAAGWRAGAATLWHIIASGLVFVVHLLAFYREYEIVFLNSQLVERALKEYETARRNH